MNPDFIITSDIHLRESNPVSRTDDYWEAVKKKMLFISFLQSKYNGIPIIDAGDLFNSWKSTPLVEAWAIKHMPKDFYTIIGNHEMPYHNIDKFPKSSLNVLFQAGKINLLKELPTIIQKPTNEKKGIAVIGFNYGHKNTFYASEEFRAAYFLIVVLHEMVTEKKTELFESRTPEEVLKAHPHADIVICGHNHKRFDFFLNNRYFLSPGSLMRSSSDQVDYEPCIHLVETEFPTIIQKVPVPIEDNVFDTKGIQLRKKKDERIDNFVEKLSTDYSVDISFESNLEKFMHANKIRNGVKEEIHIALQN